jgi:hypothetical protein
MALPVVEGKKLKQLSVNSEGEALITEAGAPGSLQGS